MVTKGIDGFKVRCADWVASPETPDPLERRHKEAKAPPGIKPATIEEIDASVSQKKA